MIISSHLIVVNYSKKYHLHGEISLLKKYLSTLIKVHFVISFICINNRRKQTLQLLCDFDSCDFLRDVDDYCFLFHRDLDELEQLFVQCVKMRNECQ